MKPLYVMAICLAGVLTIWPATSCNEKARLAYKSLQRTMVEAEAATWKVRHDGQNSTGNAELALEHQGSGALLRVEIEEKQNSPFPAEHDKYWAAYVKDMRTMARSFREVPLPKGMSPPTGFGCNAEESSMHSPVPMFIAVTCTSSRDKTQVVVTVMIGKGIDQRPHFADLNALLAGLRWK